MHWEYEKNGFKKKPYPAYPILFLQRIIIVGKKIIFLVEEDVS